MIGAVHGNQATLRSHNADGALLGDVEQVLRIAVGDVDALTVEVLVEMLDLLVACEQHQTAGTAGRLHVVLDIHIAHFRRDVYRHLNLIASDGWHIFLLRE